MQADITNEGGARMIMATIVTLGTVVWFYNYARSGSPIDLVGALIMLVVSAILWLAVAFEYERTDLGRHE